MEPHIYEALVDIERRLEEVLDDIRIVKEQAYCAYSAEKDD